MPLRKTQPAAAAATSSSPALPVRATEDMDGPTGVQTIIRDKIYGKPVCSKTQGLIDLVTHVNKPAAVYTRQCSVSLPSGLGILTHGSKPMEDSSPPEHKESLIGQFMVEILEVSANFPFVGTIMVCDEYSSKSIYHKDDWDQAYYDFCAGRDKWVSNENAEVGFKHKLELTGPSRATTADDGFTIKVGISGRRRKAIEICKLPCGTNNVCLHNQLQTRTIKTNRGCLFVTCSVMPEAMQGFVKVLLQLPSHWRGVAGATVYGLITARIGNFDIRSTLFNKDFKEAVALVAPPNDAVCSEEGYSCMRVPLMRSHLAVPLGEYVHIEGKLQVCGYDAMPITIDHRIPIDCEDGRTPWIKSGESLSAVRMRLSSIF
ncbi:unnamed protein product [Alopecurus aequalis]